MVWRGQRNASKKQCEGIHAERIVLMFSILRCLGSGPRLKAGKERESNHGKDQNGNSQDAPEASSRVLPLIRQKQITANSIYF